MTSDRKRWMLHGAQEAPGLLQTIEDFMWFKLALVRPSRGETATSSGYFASGALALPTFLHTHFAVRHRRTRNAARRTAEHLETSDLCHV